MQILSVVKKGMDKLLEWVCIIILGIMTVLVTYQVITRYFFNNPSAVSESAAQYLFVWLVMFGSAYVFGLREHLSITVLKDKFKPFSNLIIEILINIFLFVFSMSVFVMGGYNVAMKQMGTMDAALKIPIGMIYFAIPVCGATMLFYAVYNCCLAFDEYKSGSMSSGDGDGMNANSNMNSTM